MDDLTPTAPTPPTPTTSRGDGLTSHEDLTADVEAFVERFITAWRTRESAAFHDLWHPDGRLHYPFANRIILGREIGILNELTLQNAPDLTWEPLGWTSRGSVVVVEWRSSNRYGSNVVTWAGVDKLTLVDGKIIEEIVYVDTAPLQAMRLGTVFPSLIEFPDPR